MSNEKVFYIDISVRVVAEDYDEACNYAKRLEKSVENLHEFFPVQRVDILEVGQT